MSKYGHRTINWFEAIVNKLGGEEAAEKLLRGELAVSEPPKPPILRLISGGESIVIAATSGTKTIASATDVFTWGIDSDFTNWGLNVPSEAKPETSVQVFEQSQDGNFRTIFGGDGRSLDDLCFTQEQIVEFVRNHKNWLRTDSYATFFLFKEAGQFFVADVSLASGARPGVLAYRFGVGRVWGAECRRRVVLPQLKLENQN